MEEGKRARRKRKEKHEKKNIKRCGTSPRMVKCEV
jgi:hypothetical protein